MSKANYTARDNAKANILSLASNITINCDLHRCFTHNAIKHFKHKFTVQLGTCYNDAQLGQRMKLLMTEGDNTLIAIKITNRITADSILKDAHVAATTLAKQANLPKKLHINTWAEAKVEADNCNYAIQTTIGTKEGTAKAIISIVGSDVTDPILKHTNGSPKGNDKYRLSDLFHAMVLLQPNAPSNAKWLPSKSICCNTN